MCTHVYNITKWTGRDSMQLLMMRCASLRLGKRDIEDFGPHTLEASRISTEDSFSITIIIMSPASSIPDRLPHLKREPSPRRGLSLIDDDASSHQPHVSFPLIMTLRDNYTEFPRYLVSLLRRPCTATALARTEKLGRSRLDPTDLLFCRDQPPHELATLDNLNRLGSRLLLLTISGNLTLEILWQRTLRSLAGTLDSLRGSPEKNAKR